MKNDKNRIFVALSGGVDSAVAAILLKQQGFNLHAIHMQNWDPEINNENVEKSNIQGCINQIELKYAKDVAEKLNIPLTIYNFVPEYWENVFTPFLNMLKKNLISNPDILCNSQIKFGFLLKKLKADFLGNIKLATGHYAKIIHKNNQYFLATCANLNKDQTYFLSRLTQSQLKHILFPLENITNKEEVRKIAKNHNLNNWMKKDSQGICFIGKRNFKNFISNYVLPQPGKIVDIQTNKELGIHQGLCFYVLHQRYGLNISGQLEKYYTCKKDIENNILYVCGKNQIYKYLFRQESKIEKLFWINGPVNVNDSILFKTKHSNIFYKGMIKKISKNLMILLHDNIYVTTPGQYIVFYSEDKLICLGSGIYNLE